MIRLLQQEGFSITLEALCEEYPGSVITRAHFADRVVVGQGDGGQSAFFGVVHQFFRRQGSDFTTQPPADCVHKQLHQKKWTDRPSTSYSR